MGATRSKRSSFRVVARSRPHTSDLWVFEGVDGRDYAVTGTWSANGWAFFWDVTDPTNIVKTDSIQVDARTVNDVKVSPNGRYAALSREGASNRRNGVVILDMATPPPSASTFDSNGVTGGVHNMFATDDYLFALAAGDKYVIIDVTDPYQPKFVSEYNHPEQPYPRRLGTRRNRVFLGVADGCRRGRRRQRSMGWIDREPRSS